MPNRIIKESIKRSPQVDELTWFEEVVFYRLLVSADDYGCFDGRLVLLKNELFPTKENVTKKAMEDAIEKLVSVGLLCKYTASGMPYLFFPTWEKHQRLRNKHRKYPEPSLDSQLTADCCQTSADCLPESESNPNVESESKSESEKPHTPARKKYGEYGWVRLSDAEYTRLVNDMGDEELSRCIRYIDESAQGNGNKNRWKDWNIVVRRCHREGWGLDGKPKQTTKPAIPVYEEW